MRIVSLAFLLILSGVHLLNPSPEILGMPLSEFRDGPLRFWGFLLFGLLLLVGASWIRTMIRVRDPSDLTVVVPGVLMLGFVACTNSWSTSHLVCSILLLLWLLTFFTLKLLEAGSGFAFPHFVIPALLALFLAGYGFGLAQKALIVYLVIAINIYDTLRLSELDEQPKRRWEYAGWFRRLYQPKSRPRSKKSRVPFRIYVPS